MKNPTVNIVLKKKRQTDPIVASHDISPFGDLKIPHDSEVNQLNGLGKMLQSFTFQWEYQLSPAHILQITWLSRVYGCVFFAGYDYSIHIHMYSRIYKPTAYLRFGGATTRTHAAGVGLAGVFFLVGPCGVKNDRKIAMDSITTSWICNYTCILPNNSI